MKKNIKQMLLSLAIVGAFAAYIAYQRFGSSGETITVTPGTASDKPSATGGYKDGNYTGSVADAYYGTVQVKAVISGGAITDVQFLTYPNDRATSIQISNRSMSILRSEAIASQTAHVDIVSGATQTSEAFQQSLASALAQAQK